jgi:peptidoglycan/xylan/chitin deacetylase (PgdA/CDA1 family)
MRLFRPGFLTSILYPGAVFRVKTNGKVLYLTFDDGPDPATTPVIETILEKYSIRALFFCSGEAAEKHHGLIKLLISKGHLIGNHGYNHLSGWDTSTEEYLRETEKAAEFTSGFLFRPPYGRITPLQFAKLRHRYKIVFWDLMPYDFDMGFGKKESLRVLDRLIRPGSVIVLHDRRGSNSVSIVEEFIISAQARGFRFGDPEDMRS